jgi:hypothetical protein
MMYLLGAMGIAMMLFGIYYLVMLGYLLAKVNNDLLNLPPAPKPPAIDDMFVKKWLETYGPILKAPSDDKETKKLMIDGEGWKTGVSAPTPAASPRQQ